MKRAAVLAICAVFVLAATLFFSDNTYADFLMEDPLNGFQQVYGDINLDGSISTGDATIMLKYCIGMYDFNARQYINGDLNCDSSINTADVGILLRHISGIIKNLPYTPKAPQSPANELVFKNYSFPSQGIRVAYGRSYSLIGEIRSDVALKNVRIKIKDVSTGKTEIDQSVSFNPSDKVFFYNTQTSSNPIDNYIKFSALSTGEKRLELICTNMERENITLYSSVFKVGFTFEEIADYCYSTSDNVSSYEARNMLSLLNSLNINSDSGAKIVESGVSYLGRKYSQMDCSLFAQSSVKDALNITLPRTSADQAEYCADNGLNIPASEKKPGDLIFMTYTECECGRYHEIHHVAIYVGNYDGVDYLMESSSSRDGVIMRRLWGTNGGVWSIDSYARIYN